MNNERAKNDTGPHGDPPLKIKISKIGLRHVLSWPKLVIEPKFHDPGSFGGFGKREHTHRQTRFMFYKYRLSPPSQIFKSWVNRVKILATQIP